MSRLWRTYLNHILRSPLTWASIALSALTAYSRFIYTDAATSDIVGSFDVLFTVDSYRKLIPMIVSLPFASQFAREWNSRIFDMVIARSGYRSYVRTQIVTCILSSFCVCFLSLLIYTGLCSFSLPLFKHGFNDPGRIFPPYGFLIENGYTFIFILIKISVFSLSCSLWSLCGMVLSSIFPNVYVAFCAPFIFSYLVERLTHTLPTALDFYIVSLGYAIFPEKGALFNYLYNVCFFLIWMLPISLVFRYVIGKRVRCEFR